MKEFLLSDSELEILRSLINTQISQIVWDINAFYFVFEGRTIKLEAKDDKPESKESWEYDEIFFITLDEMNQKIYFHTEGEDGLWYKVIQENVKIREAKIVRALIKFPEEILVKKDAGIEKSGLNLVDCGILFYLDNGIIPTVIYDNIYGFHNSKKIDIHTSEEVDLLLNDQYQIIDLT